MAAGTEDIGAAQDMSGPSNDASARRATHTRYAERTPLEARAILAVLVALIAWGALGSGSELARRGPAARDIDTNLYRAVVERVHAGEPYYDAAGIELRGRGFATRPFWNWRLPTLAWLTAQLPHPALARGLLAASAFGALLLWIPVLRDRAPLAVALLGGLLVLGALLPSLSEQGFYFHEVWAGVWIAVSLAAWGLGLPWLSVGAGLFALFVRELALPYLGVMFLLAWVEHRRREAWVWLAGGALFALALCVHAFVVSQRLGDAELVNESWIRFGGWSFVLATARWNAYLLPAPSWVVALIFPLCLLGLVGWRSRVGARAALTVGAYVCAYAIAGRPDNTYWGFVYAPLLPLGLLFAPASLADLWRAATARVSAT
jgi:hypothetical protein